MSRTLRIVSAVAAALACTAATAAVTLPELSDKQIETYRKASTEASSAFGDDDVTGAARAFRRALGIDASNDGTWYNLACAEARRGQTALALQALDEARDAGWRDASWPQRDSDLASLHETIAFAEWIASVEALRADPDATWPEVDPATLATSEDEIDARSEARDKELRRLSGVVGSRVLDEARRELVAWKAASWDAIAAAARRPDERAEARVAAMKAVAGRDARSADRLAAEQLLTRADAFASEHPASDLLPRALLTRAHARFALSRAAAVPDLDAARAGLARDLLVLAATSDGGEATEVALGQAMGLLTDDASAAGRLLGRLESLAGDERARELALDEARGAYYKLRGLPSFEATTLEGGRFSPDALRGKVTLIDFWATWCGPCRAELPAVKETYAKYADRGFQVVGVSLDNESDKDVEAFQAWCAENELPWPQVYDGKGWKASLAETFGVNSIPFPLLVDRAGKVVAADGELRGENLAVRVEQELSRARGVGVAGQ